MERETSNVNQKEMLLEKKQQIETSHKSDLDTHLNKWLGKHVDELYEEFGDPTRKDVTKYGYNAYVYNEKQNEYIVFGIDNEEIVTVFGTGLNLSLNMFSIGDSYEQILEHVAFEEKISFRKGTSTYTIELLMMIFYNIHSLKSAKGNSCNFILIQLPINSSECVI